jgi:hypothetical protein
MAWWGGDSSTVWEGEQGLEVEEEKEREEEEEEEEEKEEEGA